MDLVSILNDRFQYVNNGAVKNFPELKWESAVTFKQNTSSKVSENLFSKIDLKDFIEHKPKKTLSVAGTRYNVVQVDNENDDSHIEDSIGNVDQKTLFTDKNSQYDQAFCMLKGQQLVPRNEEPKFLIGPFFEKYDPQRKNNLNQK